MQEALGIETPISQNWDVRAAFSDLHFSNAFVVPSNPGIDLMSYTIGLSHRFPTHHFPR
ncbi:MAG: hypothetical protein KGN79_09060 [Acidobacteriota bacterium]|nr:hypothetical protein [Acidobacteriota bacterium]